MNSNNKKEVGWCKTWKGLLIVSNLSSMFFLCINILSKRILSNYSGGAIAKLVMAIILCHCGVIASMFLFVKNYNILVKQNTIEKSKSKVIGGLIPLIVYELINILVLI